MTAVGNISFSETHLTEHNRDGSIALRIPYAALRDAELGYGFTSERQLLQLVLGGALVAGMLWPLVSFAGDRGKPLFSARILVGMLFCIVIGALLLRSALHRGHFLRLTTTDGVRKLRLDRETDPKAVVALVREYLPRADL